MLTLKGRTVVKTVEAEIGKSLLDHALAHGIDVGFSCTRGTCARCRCYVEEGRALLNEPTDAEFDRLDEDEIEQGYRLGCQAVIRRTGDVRAVNRTYF
ncbi:2Fe-2S iron-sulfur cluster-binding protein [Paenibacillus sp.]|uniref:2Fe-2S iron-sulfur cluster-binding protein n=1 Tax=Paenibacillus sp. TaxID=58172 RepID=UPI002D581D01|nr:2Fe-2S iron-sulfur cluster-binding protein [Paenibacillus sp.]HZG57477.1 2Fe-2S iron-sulfur cluster-binding protein [Paenibacillus sp.]